MQSSGKLTAYIHDKIVQLKHDENGIAANNLYCQILTGFTTPRNESKKKTGFAGRNWPYARRDWSQWWTLVDMGKFSVLLRRDEFLEYVQSLLTPHALWFQLIFSSAL